MPQESYVPTDVKITVEKAVKPKPSLAELTKVESPGRPTPADMLEDAPKEKKRKSPSRKTPKSSNVLIGEPEKDSILIVTEKPQAAQKIASALGSPRKYTEDGVSYFELERNNKKILVASAVGHLFGLTYVKGQKGWPIFQVEWVPSYDQKKAAFTKKYYNLLKRLSQRAKEVVIATDFDTEGEVIGWNVLRFICKKKNAKRMKYSTLTKPELEKSYDSPLPELYWGNAYAGETRHILDWLYGINLSRALMSAIKRTDSFRILSIGRVQGPALKIIVDREREIDSFKPVPYWEALAYIKEQEFKHPKDIFDKKELDKFKGTKQAMAETKKSEESIAPPVPFDLTTLQREAYRVIHLSPSQTLQTAQKLYLDGIISYPRTSSQKIPKEIEPLKILKKLEKQFPETKIATRKIPIEGKKEDPAHPCFTEDTKITFATEEKSFKEIAKNIRIWEFDKEKRSYFADISIPELLTYSDTSKKIEFSKAYQIWKTPIAKPISYFKDINLKVTDNHPVYAITKKGIGYFKAGELEEGDYIIKKDTAEKKGYLLKFKEKDLLKAYSEKNFREIKTQPNLQIAKSYKNVKEIIKNINFDKAIKLAKISGFCMGDGHIHFEKPSKNRENYPTVHFVGRLEDMKNLKQDIENLGFSAYITKNKNCKEYPYLVSKNSNFGRTLIALGCPVGDKVAKPYDIPNWIKKAPIAIKKAFIGGLFGAEITKTRVHTKNPRDIRPFSFVQNKLKIFEKEEKIYFNSIVSILSELEIQTSEIKVKDKIIRKKDGGQTIEMLLEIKNNRENLIRFLKEIKLGYCGYKDASFRKALAYLLFRERIINEREDLRRKAVKLYKKNKKFKEIGKELGLSEFTIKGWVYYKKGNKENHVPIEKIPKFEDFEYQIPERCVPIRLSNISKLKFKGFVYDLEIEKTHNYFPNSVLVHNCIYPTGELPDSLSEVEEKLYNLIAKRFISAFSPDAKTANKRVVLTSTKNPDITFTANGLVITDKGWTNVYPSTMEEVKLDDYNGKVNIDKLEFPEKETQPPKRYTPASLISLLEKKNLGTKATRSSIVDTLFTRGYLDGKSITATPLGKKLIEALEKYSPIIIDEELTRQIEKEMELLEEKNSPEELEKKEKEFVSKTEKIITDISKDFKAHEEKIGKMLQEGLQTFRKEQNEANTIIQCPTCNKGNLRILYNRASRRYFVACGAYPECKQTYTLPPNALIKKSDKICDFCKYPKLLALRQGKRPWEFCFNPNCEDVKRRREEWEKKKAELSSEQSKESKQTPEKEETKE